MNIHVPSTAASQAPLALPSDNELTAAITSLSIGGAERIVLDWAARIYPRWRVHLIVLRDREKEWSVPAFVRVTRLQSAERFRTLQIEGDVTARRLELLSIVGKEIAQTRNPVCVCHLLGKAERDALAKGGAAIVPVLHNARDGWCESASALVGSTNVIAVSAACAEDLREGGWQGAVTVIRHIPSKRLLAPNAREECRKAWNVPEGATVIGMIGAVKAQKNYARALQVLKALHEHKDAYLVILGGPVNTQEGRTAWESVVSEVHRLGLRSRVAMPGFVPDAAARLPALDAVLNTSRFEGLSIATLEALVHGMSVVASKVGGQGELAAAGLALLPLDTPDSAWVAALLQALTRKYPPPAWADFQSYRLWTLVGLARPFVPGGKTLFVTANLNSGGAQRSLVNLAMGLVGKLKHFPAKWEPVRRRKCDHSRESRACPDSKGTGHALEFEVAVAGNSTENHFHDQLVTAGVEISRSADNFDAFVHAESLVQKICAERIGTVCYWNVDPKVKLLVTKALSHTNVRFLDVSPGGYSFEEMAESAEFCEYVAYSPEDYYRRLDKLVLKFDGPYPPACKGKRIVIRNGVPRATRPKTDYALRNPPRVVVNGRVAPSKFLLEIVAAMQLVREKIPDAELHVFGGAEAQHRDYADEVLRASGTLADGVHFHGTSFNVVDELADFDACVVLGRHQGCPNALLEALSVGMPVVANDDGGTREQVIPGRTGLLIEECSPQLLAEALHKLLADRALAQRLGRAGRKHVRASFSMQDMTRRYLWLLAGRRQATSKAAPDPNPADEPMFAERKGEIAACPGI